MLTNNINTQRLLNIYPLCAVIILKDKDFEHWLSLRNHMLEEWHKDNSKEIMPCMKGYHYKNGKHHML